MTPFDIADRRAADLAVGIIGLFAIIFVGYGACRWLSNSPDALLEKGAVALKATIERRSAGSSKVELPTSVEGCKVAAESLTPLKPPSGYKCIRGQSIPLGANGRPVEKIAIRLSVSQTGMPSSWLLWDGDSFAVSKVNSATGQPLAPTPLK